VLSEETTGLIDAEALAMMKPSAFLVNTSRGPVVREDDLVAALREGTIAAAALDTFDQEPLPADHRFRELPNLVLTPHLGYVTRDVYAEFFEETVRSTAAYLNGEPIRLLTQGGSAATAVVRRYEDG
jgi:phosphoglycerate dehydrogenase-like enzyme